ncbi:hypothetical protein SAICODRAFT_8808 [Saitoella complicata NRRL Y-17804]|uniref:Uncharacterized protein n=1 Tax=Saitoella complicata (strain BCRC 22490 / CBS 7301 / JCM 7358 / NBRC 10748 / NRRL Y-17804) TaxID=698492 RepID=A0A0E9NBS6_SAICN|nr:uncharacterized protein SAICODRAFT_8808 [Saitoella complicata NRRL Y-17804]ODQ51508.1 hypothetical protein SAICODRAFT_8808 [Saitoella complicata NRRL Y-17804]GAO47258.1 hypothetical protein G7K_1468-t1 [Saitoella complicata NRRL Y-17804]
MEGAENPTLLSSTPSPTSSSPPSSSTTTTAASTDPLTFKCPLCSTDLHRFALNPQSCLTMCTTATCPFPFNLLKDEFDARWSQNPRLEWRTYAGTLCPELQQQPTNTQTQSGGQTGVVGQGTGGMAGVTPGPAYTYTPPQPLIPPFRASSGYVVRIPSSTTTSSTSSTTTSTPHLPTRLSLDNRIPTIGSTAGALPNHLTPRILAQPSLQLQMPRQRVPGAWPGYRHGGERSGSVSVSARVKAAPIPAATGGVKTLVMKPMPERRGTAGTAGTGSGSGGGQRQGGTGGGGGGRITEFAVPIVGGGPPGGGPPGGRPGGVQGQAQPRAQGQGAGAVGAIGHATYSGLVQTGAQQSQQQPRAQTSHNIDAEFTRLTTNANGMVTDEELHRLLASPDIDVDLDGPSSSLPSFLTPPASEPSPKKLKVTHTHDEHDNWEEEVGAMWDAMTACGQAQRQDGRPTSTCSSPTSRMMEESPAKHKKVNSIGGLILPGFELAPAPISRPGATKDVGEEPDGVGSVLEGLGVGGEEKAVEFNFDELGLGVGEGDDAGDFDGFDELEKELEGLL